MTTTQIVTINPGDKGADYVSLTPTVKAWLLANDIRFVIRYIARRTLIGKIVTADEIAWLHANRIAVCLNYEGSENDLYTGAVGGVANGAWSRTAAEGYGCPPGVALFVSVDTDVTGSNLGTATAYARGFLGQVGGYRPGVYGDTDLLGAVKDLHPVGWLPNAWLYNAIAGNPSVHIKQGRQVNGIDPNVCVAAFPAWLPHEPPPVIAPPVIAPPVIVTPPAPGKENTLMNQLFTVILDNGTDAAAKFYGVADKYGNILQCEWTGDGNPATPTGRKLAAHIGAGIELRTVGIGSLANMTLLGPLPVGDTAHAWSATDFARVIG